MKTYDLHLPVFKQGDDLAHHLNANNGHPIKAFLDMAEQYKSAAEICQTVANTLSKVKNINSVKVDADTHCIWVYAKEKDVASLIKKEILVEENFDEE